MVGAETALLPAGFEFPLVYLVGLGMGTLIVGVLLAVLQPEVTTRDVLALGVWMMVGSTLHALEVIGAFPDTVAPLFGAPAVYLTTFIAAGGLWLVASVGATAELFSSTARILGAVGVLAFTLLVAFLVSQAEVVTPVWPAVGLFAAVLVAALGFIALALVHTEAVAATGRVGAFVVFAHSLDGVSTAIGVDVLCNGPIAACEQTPLPRLIMGFAADLNLPVDIGVGWLFVLTKVVLALVIVAVFADYLKEAPSRGRLTMALLAAVGLGPGVFNLLLFLVSAGG